MFTRKPFLLESNLNFKRNIIAQSFPVIALQKKKHNKVKKQVRHDKIVGTNKKF